MATKHINTEKVKPQDDQEMSETLIRTNYKIRWQNTKFYQKYKN